MKKRILTLLLVLLISFALTVPAFAETGNFHMVDTAGLLTSIQEAALESKLAEISARQGTEVCIVTVSSLEGTIIADYSEYFYEYYMDDVPAVVLFIAMDEREWDIAAYGGAETAFNAASREYIGGQILDSLSDEDFNDAFTDFAALCDDFLTQAASGEPYGSGNLPKEPMAWYSILIALGIGLVVALIVTGVMRSALKSVAMQRAAEYVRPGSLQLTRSQDIFLYRTVSRRERPKSSTSSGSGAGSSSGNHTSGTF